MVEGNDHLIFLSIFTVAINTGIAMTRIDDSIQND
jgi:hypothetical protein